MFNLQGGTVASSSYRVKYGEPIPDLPKAPEVAHPLGHKFDGWYWDNSYLTPYVENSAMPGHNVTLYAKWIIDPVEVKFYPAEGSTVSLDSITISKGSYLFLEQIPTLGEDFKFDIDGDNVPDLLGDFVSWVYDFEYEGITIPIPVVDVTNIPINSDMSFYARYKPKVEINLDDFSGSDIAVDLFYVLTKIYGDDDPVDIETMIERAIREWLVSVQGLSKTDADTFKITVGMREKGENVVGGPYTIPVEVTAASGSNYTVTGKAAAALVIARRPITITTGSANKVFDGTALATGAWSCSGERLGDTPVVTVSGSQTAVGSSRNTVTDWQIVRGVAPVTDNYDITWALGTLTVSAVPVVWATPPTIFAAFAVPAVLAAAVISDATAQLTPAPTLQTPPDDDTPAPTPAPLPQVSDGFVGQWALLNLILAIVAAIFAFALIIHFFTDRRKDESKHEQRRLHRQAQRSKHEQGSAIRNRQDNTIKGVSGNLWRVLTIILGIISPIVFLLTENMTLPLVIADRWTLLMAAFVIVQVVLTLVMWQVRKPGVRKPNRKDANREAVNDS
jgi:uncharacterized repeat protein (TIGR02543 family)